MIDLSHFVSQDEIYHWMIEILRDQKDLFVKLLKLDFAGLKETSIVL